jgi:type IV fimbrial biogenesis protein FimT
MRTPRNRQLGSTLVEQLLGAVLAGLLVLLALPGLIEAKDKHRIESLAAQIETELQFARSESVGRRETIRVGFVNRLTGTCYVIFAGSPRQCTCVPNGGTQCQGGGEVLRLADPSSLDRISLMSSAREISFDPVHGTVTPTTTLRLENPRGDRLNLVVNLVGRIRSCSPGRSLVGYPGC